MCHLSQRLPDESIDALELATEGAESIAPQEISKWLESSASATQEPFPSPGIGVDVRVEGKDVIGASLVIDDRPIHMELVRRTAPQQAAASDQWGRRHRELRTRLRVRLRSNNSLCISPSESGFSGIFNTVWRAYATA